MTSAVAGSIELDVQCHFGQVYVWHLFASCYPGTPCDSGLSYSGC